MTRIGRIFTDFFLLIRVICEIRVKPKNERRKNTFFSFKKSAKISSISQICGQ
jgi:hypothetical protein